MATFTISLPEDVKKRMDEHPEINWPEYIKQRFEVRLKEFKRFEELRNSGKLFEK
jgi:predicted GIY-YIG superfamily endonuclease